MRAFFRSTRRGIASRACAVLATGALVAGLGLTTAAPASAVPPGPPAFPSKTCTTNYVFDNQGLPGIIESEMRVESQTATDIRYFYEWRATQNERFRVLRTTLDIWLWNGTEWKRVGHNDSHDRRFRIRAKKPWYAHTTLTVPKNAALYIEGDQIKWQDNGRAQLIHLAGTCITPS